MRLDVKQIKFKQDTKPLTELKAHDMHIQNVAGLKLN